MDRRTGHRAMRFPLWCCYSILALRTGSAGRSLLQSDNVQCLAFVPFQASDYEYIRSLANMRRRESFALSRDRGRDTSGELAADSPWSFDALYGGQSDGERQALTAFPKMNKRSEDLYAAFFIASIEDETGVDINDSVGKSSKMPYYFVQTICDGNCQELTPEERARIDANARSSRSVVSCVDKEQLAEDPFLLPLPFTPDGEIPDQTPTVSNFDELVGAAATGQPATFTTPGAEADQAATQADPESELPLEELFVPAPPVAVVPFEAFAPSPIAIPALAPGALLPEEVPVPAPEAEAPTPVAPSPVLLVPALAPGDLPAMAQAPFALQPGQPPLSIAPPVQGEPPRVVDVVQAPRGRGGGNGDDGSDGDGDGDGAGDLGGGSMRGGPGVDAGVESNQAETDMARPQTYDIDWRIVCLAIAGTVVVGAVAALVRHGAIAHGCTCCQCACCFALVAKRPARADSSSSSGAILPLHHGISLLTPGGGVLGSAFEGSSPGTSGSVRAGAPVAPGSSSGSVIGPHGSAATWSPAGAGKSGAPPIATVSSGEDSLENWAQLVVGGTSGMRELGTATSNMSASLAHGGIGPSGSAIFRTASHSGSVSLAYLAMPHQSTTHLGSSNSNALSHGESSALNSGDSATLPSATAAGTPLASPNGNGNGSSSSVTLPMMGMAAVAAAGTHEWGAAPAAAAEEHGLLRNSPEQRAPVVQLASRQRTVADAAPADERKASSPALSMSPAQARILGTVKEESESREATMETREGTVSALLAHGREDRIDEVSEGSSEGMATTLDEIASKMEGMSDRGLDTEGTSTTDGEGLLSSAQLLAESAAGQAAHEGDRLLAQYSNRSDVTQTPAEMAVTGLGPSQARRHVFVSPEQQGQAGGQAGLQARVPPEHEVVMEASGGSAGRSAQTWEADLQTPPAVQPHRASLDDTPGTGIGAKHDSA